MLIVLKFIDSDHLDRFMVNEFPFSYSKETNSISIHAMRKIEMDPVAKRIT